MNYLAHLFLAEDNFEHRIGSLLADFTNGTISNLAKRFSYGVARGIKHHRAVDRYTDSHQAVAHSVALLQKEYGFYAGIIIDVVFDHFLLRNWTLFSSVKPEIFFEEIYLALSKGDFDYPERYQIMLDRLLDIKWLGVYANLENVGVALRKIDERFSRETPLPHALKGIRQHYTYIEADFLLFFPDLIKYSKIIDSNFDML